MIVCGNCGPKPMHCFPPCELKRPIGQKRHCSKCRRDYQEKYKIRSFARSHKGFNPDDIGRVESNLVKTTK